MPAFLKIPHMVYICNTHSVRMRASCGPRTERTDELFPHFVAKKKKKNATNSITEMLELFGIVIESHARYRHMFLIFPVSLYQVAALWRIKTPPTPPLLGRGRRASRLKRDF